MQFNSTYSRNMAYGLLGILAILIMCCSFSIKNNIINSVFGVKNIKAYNDAQEYTHWDQGKEGFTVREGFSFNTDNVKDDNIDDCINRKLTSLKTELGGTKGINGIKKILKNTKQSTDYEATKCMMNLLSSNKTTKSIDLESILNDPENKDCARYKEYTELSSKLKDLIDSI